MARSADSRRWAVALHRATSASPSLRDPSSAHVAERFRAAIVAVCGRGAARRCCTCCAAGRVAARRHRLRGLRRARALRPVVLAPGDARRELQLAAHRARRAACRARVVRAHHAWISPHLTCILATDDAVDRPVLSHQETRARQLYATGMPMKSVARKMTISEESAKQHLGRVREKYSRVGRAAPTKLELYYRAVEDGHLPHPRSHDPPPWRRRQDVPVLGFQFLTRVILFEGVRSCHDPYSGVSSAVGLANGA